MIQEMDLNSFDIWYINEIFNQQGGDDVVPTPTECKRLVLCWVFKTRASFRSN